MNQQKAKVHTIIDSFNAAIEGFLYVIKTQRNMRIHFLLAVLVLLLGIYLNFTRMELIALSLICGMVLISEMFNTAMEIMLNYVEASHARWVRRVKDISAGAVLIASICAVIIGYLLFFKNNVLYQLFNYQLLKVSQSDWHISFIILIVVISLVIMGKTIFRKGTPLRGGMPSGHSAVAFSVWMLVALISHNTLLVFIVFILALLVAQSRIARHYHTAVEVIAGSAIGILATVVIYRLLAG